MFMSNQSTEKNLIEVFVTCPILKLNKDYKVKVFTCVSDPSDAKGHKRKEHKVGSKRQRDQIGAKIHT
jgi:hypothetical protein